MPTTITSGGIYQPDKIRVANEFNSVLMPLSASFPDQEEITSFNATTGWTILGDDTANLTTDLNHIIGTASLEFDKVDGTDNTIFAGVQKTLSPALDLSRFGPDDELQGYASCPTDTNLAYAFVRLGTDSSNYNEWHVADTAFASGTWGAFHATLASCVVAVTGNGWNPAAVAWVAVGFAFDAETNALADLLWNCLRIVSSRHTRT